MKQGTLIFDEHSDRYDIRFDLEGCYGALAGKVPEGICGKPLK